MLIDAAQLLEGQVLECYAMSNPERGKTEEGRKDLHGLARKVLETICPKYRASADNEVG